MLARMTSLALPLLKIAIFKSGTISTIFVFVPEHLEGLLVAEHVFTRLHHHGQTRVDVVSALLQLKTCRFYSRNRQIPTPDKVPQPDLDCILYHRSVSVIFLLGTNPRKIRSRAHQTEHFLFINCLKGGSSFSVDFVKV